ncbi:hypothetical protein SLEP1_g8157 [Rubroshorea leprosula]|uniref:Uncharacterized protein n=1 Tax=Rubroshorea leprosula TaxID=152421 RepID=A0AAV5IBS8_9ROSI|nr:hypothetical protein SLEP1_g8157 [Rubroshorea leprosula]
MFIADIFILNHQRFRTCGLLMQQGIVITMDEDNVDFRIVRQMNDVDKREEMPVTSRQWR